MSVIRLDKYMAACAVGSRKYCKDLIKYRRVLVNSLPAQRGEQKIDTEDTVCVDGEVLLYRQYVYIMMNKPENVLSASYDKYRRTVLDLLNGEYGSRDISCVGRLDIDTTGLLLITDDGALNHFLLSPKRHVDKVYEAELARPVNQSDIDAFASGMNLGDFTAQSAKLESLVGARARVTICEGKFHEVKRLFAATGNEVKSLDRVSFGPLTLDPALERGQYRELSEAECEALKEAGAGER